MRAKAKQEKSSKALKTKTENFMNEKDFARLELSLKQAAAHAKGEIVEGMRVDKVPVPPPVPKPRSKAKIVTLRHNLNCSQASFAKLLNVSVKTVQAWEQGVRKPSYAALKLLAIAEKHPEALFDSV